MTNKVIKARNTFLIAFILLFMFRKLNFLVDKERSFLER